MGWFERLWKRPSSDARREIREDKAALDGLRRASEKVRLRTDRIIEDYARAERARTGGIAK